MSKYVLTIILLSLMSFSQEKDLDSARLIKIEEHYYSMNFKSNSEYLFYYNMNKLDSITHDRYNDKRNMDIIIFKYNPNIIEGYEKFTHNGSLKMKYLYKLDSKGRLSEFISYDYFEIQRQDKYTYNKSRNIIKIKTFEKREVDGLVTFKEKICFVNNMNNIDSTYEYYIDNKKHNLNTIYIYKYDTKPNPLKNIFFYEISEEYFNSNNIVSCRYLNDNRTVRLTRKNNYAYNTDGRLIKYLDDDIFETDSIVHIYHYNK